MKYDEKIKHIIKKIKLQSDNYLYCIESMNECAFTDRIIEDIIKNSKELEKYHENRFEKFDNEKEMER